MPQVTKEPFLPEELPERVWSNSEAQQHRHLIVVQGNVYNVSSYLRKHPGGVAVVEPYFYGGDATEAFDETGHSKGAYRFLEKLRVGRLASATEKPASEEAAAIDKLERGSSLLGKFFTREDRYQVHKVLGVYVLLHYIYRMARIVGGHPTGGFSASWLSLATVVPHAVLSCSSFIFHIPRERVVGKPMIWQEFRAHNVGFALRSFVGFVLLWAAQRAVAVHGAGSAWAWSATGLAVAGTGAAVLGAMLLADAATRRLRVDTRESTTGTMPYWEGCSERTQGRFKAFYTLAQLLATVGVLASINLSWAFIIMFPIQFASVLMTCVRKGALSTRGYHILYTVSLVIPFFVGMLTEAKMFPYIAAGGLLLYQVRMRLPRGTAGAKYVLWAAAAAARVALFLVRGV